MATLNDRLEAFAERVRDQFNGLSGGFVARPPIGWNQGPAGLLAVSSLTLTAAMRRLLKVYPHLVGPAGWTCDQAQILIGSGTTPAGGASVILEVAIFGDDNGTPDWAAGPLRIATFASIMTNGTKTQAWDSGGALVLEPGLYWPVTRFDYGTVPTTFPQVQANSNSVWQLGQPTGSGYGPSRGYVSTATHTSMPAAASGLTLAADFTISGGTEIPIALLHRSA